MSAIKYRGYTARVEYDPEDRIFVGHLAGIEDIVGFHGTTVDELEQAFHEAVDHYIEASEQLGREPQKPYSGRLMLRIDPEVHAAASIAAKVKGTSLNKWAEQVLREAASRYSCLQ